jgi:hypothetical protein
MKTNKLHSADYDTNEKQLVIMLRVTVLRKSVRLSIFGVDGMERSRNAI